MGLAARKLLHLNPADFGLTEEHEKILKTIHELDDIDLPISPIDYLKDQLERNGIRTGELTGRNYTVDYSKETPVLSKREADDKNKNKIVNDFNSGNLDAVILNKAGSTGLSIHAAAWFNDKRPRHMIMVQPALDISTVVQILGRIMRTGQVVKPSYEFLSSPLTAEKRPFMVLSKKLQSLNANTTANNKSEIELGEDIINKYGDFVAKQYLEENLEIRESLNLDPEVMDELMTKLTGRMALMSDSQQAEIYEDLSARYDSLVDYLKRIGDYDLEISVHDDWDVVSGEEAELAPGDPNGSVFMQPVNMKKISLSEKYAILPADEVRKNIRENLGANRSEVIERLEQDLAKIESSIENLEQSYEEGRREKQRIYQ